MSQRAIAELAAEANFHIPDPPGAGGPGLVLSLKRQEVLVLVGQVLLPLGQLIETRDLTAVEAIRAGTAEIEEWLLERGIRLE